MIRILDADAIEASIGTGDMPEEVAELEPKPKIGFFSFLFSLFKIFR